MADRSQRCDVRVLGINCHLHDAAASLVVDGEVVAAVREERFTGRPHDASFPARSIAWCLEEGQLEMGDLDGVAYYWRPWIGLPRRAAALASAFPRSLKILAPSKTVRGTPATLFKHLAIPATLTARFGRPRRFRFIPHHLAHLAGAFLPSPFEETALVSMDLAGEIASTAMAIGRGDTVSVIGQVTYPHSLGSFFAAMTQYLGFRPLWDEYKTMGLAGFGDDRYYKSLRGLVTLLPEGKFELDLEAIVHHHGGDDFFSSKVEMLLGARRAPGTPPTEPQYAAVARATQLVLEDVALHVAKHTVELSGTRNLCLAGGVALNGVMASRLRSELRLDRLFIPPAPDDAGASAGAALAMWQQLAGGGRAEPSSSSLSRIGPSSSRESARGILARFPGLKVLETEDWVEAVAAALAAGEIVAWHQGAAEFGPRALGGRSLLADPGDPSVRDRIGSAIKDREGFRPFAASVVEEQAGMYFNVPEAMPYMVEVCDVAPSKRSVLPAITHVDGTCRVQTVSRDDDPVYWRLLREFGHRSGYPVLLNTSFNRNGQAMVCSVEQAVSTFLSTPLRLLVVEGLIVTKG